MVEKGGAVCGLKARPLHNSSKGRYLRLRIWRNEVMIRKRKARLLLGLDNQRDLLSLYLAHVLNIAIVNAIE